VSDGGLFFRNIPLPSFDSFGWQAILSKPGSEGCPPSFRFLCLKATAGIRLTNHLDHKQFIVAIKATAWIAKAVRLSSPSSLIWVLMRNEDGHVLMAGPKCLFIYKFSLRLSFRLRLLPWLRTTTDRHGRQPESHKPEPTFHPHSVASLAFLVK
jgi:hypothetical protein